MGLSLRPEDAVVSGGFLDDEDVIIKTVRAAMFDYAGTRVNDPSPAICVEYDRGDGETNEQYYTVGKSKDTAPSNDGKTFNNLRSDPRSGLPEKSNGMIWLQAIINAGFPADKIGDDLSVFDGTEVHVNQIPALERKGLAGTKDKTILIVTKINALANEKSKSKSKSTVKSTASKGKSKAATPATTPTATDTDVDEVSARAAELLLTTLASNPEGIKKAALIPKVVPNIAADDPLRSQIVPKIIEDAFLATQQGWTYANGIVTL